jgi:hypothetical protein
MPKYEICDVIMADGTTKWAILEHRLSGPAVIYSCDTEKECKEALAILAYKSIGIDFKRREC